MRYWPVVRWRLNGCLSTRPLSTGSPDAAPDRQQRELHDDVGRAVQRRRRDRVAGEPVDVDERAVRRSSSVTLMHGRLLSRFEAAQLGDRLVAEDRLAADPEPVVRRVELAEDPEHEPERAQRDDLVGGQLDAAEALAHVAVLEHAAASRRRA